MTLSRIGHEKQIHMENLISQSDSRYINLISRNRLGSLRDHQAQQQGLRWPSSSSITQQIKHNTTIYIFVIQSSTTTKLTTANVEHNAEVGVGFRCNIKVAEVDTGMQFQEEYQKNIDTLQLCGLKI
jgi:hypothetical protein